MACPPGTLACKRQILAPVVVRILVPEGHDAAFAMLERGGGRQVRGQFEERRIQHAAAAELRRHRFQATPERIEGQVDRKRTRLNSSHYCASRMPSSA